LIDAFIDALWLEEGLAKNTLAAYRRDLTLYAAWLAARGRLLTETSEIDLNAYFGEQHAATKATTANRRLTVFKRYFRWALRERIITADPTLKLQAAKQALRVPKTLTESQVEALLWVPDTDTAQGVRDRTMLELMYASGLRVSELVTLQGVQCESVGQRAAGVRQGQQGAAGAVWRSGQRLACALPERSTASAAGGQADRRPVCHPPRCPCGHGHEPRHVLDDCEKTCAQRRHHRAAVAAHPCAMPFATHLLNHGADFAGGADAAGACRHFYHYHLHPRGARAA
jgi:integrase/recombinase XerD